MLSSQQAAIVRFTTKLTDTPWNMHRSDADDLRQAGLSDRAILDLYADAILPVTTPIHVHVPALDSHIACHYCSRCSVQVVAYYGYVNRLVAGLGVPFGSSCAALVEGAPGL